MNEKPHDWQWRDELWGDSPTAPASPEQVPEPDGDGWPGWLRRLMRWSRT